MEYTKGKWEVDDLQTINHMHQVSCGSKKIAFIQLNQEGVKEFHMINNTDSIYPKIISFQHVKPGDTLPAYRLGVIDFKGDNIQWLQIPGNPRGNYITRFDWANNSEELFIQQLNRKQLKLVKKV